MKRPLHHFRALNLLVWLFLVAGCVAGCYPGQTHIFNGRPLDLQRRQLQRFDPYPDNDIGPPVVGARPPGFQEQITEPSRSRWLGPASTGGGLPPLDPLPAPLILGPTSTPRVTIPP